MRKPLDYYLSLKYPVLLVAEPEEAYEEPPGKPTLSRVG